jgi:hypothetical protein
VSYQLSINPHPSPLVHAANNGHMSPADPPIQRAYVMIGDLDEAAGQKIASAYPGCV